MSSTVTAVEKKIGWWLPIAWKWIVQAARDIFSFVYLVLGFFREDNGKWSWKRLTGTVTFIMTWVRLVQGEFLIFCVLLGYSGLMAILTLKRVKSP